MGREIAHCIAVRASRGWDKLAITTKRGPDYETFLIRRITAAHIDADLVRQTLGQQLPTGKCSGGGLRGFPVSPRSFGLVRRLRHRLLRAGGVRGCLPRNRLSGRLGRLLRADGPQMADCRHGRGGRGLRVDPRTYRKVQDHVYGAMQAGLRRTTGTG